MRFFFLKNFTELLIKGEKNTVSKGSSIMGIPKDLLSFVLFRLMLFTFFVLLWQGSALLIANPDFPSFIDVLNSLRYHLSEGDMLANILITLQRVSLSFVIAMLLGGVIGIAMGVNSWLNKLTDALLIVLLNVPALVTIILCYIWIGLVEAAAVAAVVINKVPTVVVMIREGARAVDRDLLAVAKIYQLPASTTFFKVFLPQLYPFIIASARSGLSLIWKIVLVVELLGRSDGVGFALNTLFQFFDIAGILAYTFTFILVVLLIEILFFKPFDKLVARGAYCD